MPVGDAPMATVTLYTRPGCHLCEQAHAIVIAALRGMELPVRVVDIDEDAALRDRYTNRVPVVAVDTEDVLEWPFTLAQAQRMLATRLDRDGEG
jgi:hypothetical protein